MVIALFFNVTKGESLTAKKSENEEKRSLWDLFLPEILEITIKFSPDQLRSKIKVENFS
jgi:hypothetical protein